MKRKSLFHGLLCLVILVSCVFPALAEEPVINLSFQDADLLQVFKSLATIGQLNVVTDHSVTGTVTVELAGVPVLEAIDLVARTAGYEYAVVNGTLVIASPERLAEQFVAKTYYVRTPQYLSLADAKALAQLVVGETNVQQVEGKLILYASAAEISTIDELWAQVDQRAGALLDNVSVRSALEAVAEQAGWTLFMVGELEGSITTDFSKLPPEKALELLAEFFQFNYTLEDQILVIRPRPVAEEETSNRVVFLNEISAGMAREMLSSMYPEEIAVETLGDRYLLLRGTASLVEEVAAVLSQLDQPRAQVLVEARIQEVTREDLAKLGLSWTLPRIDTDEGGKPLALSIDWPSLEVALDALLTHGNSRLLAHPKIAAVDGEQARIFIGDRVPVVLKDEDEGVVRETIEYFQSGVLLEITPRISSEGTITLQVDTQISSITGSTAQGFPQTRTREAQTQVRVKDGQPLMIGGLIKDEETLEGSGVPVLSQLPLIGELFRTRTNKVQQTEMLIFLVPHIVTDGDLLESPPQEISIVPPQPEPTSAVLVEVGDLLAGNVNLRVEKRINPWTYALLGHANESGWGLGAGVRRTYEPVWAELSLYYLSEGQEEGYSLLTSSGMRFVSDRLILEGYVSYPLATSLETERTTGLGFNVGMEF